MSTIRNQLEEARDAYQSARYPGDLASELLSLKLTAHTISKPQMAVAGAVTRNRWFWAGGTTSAAAAALIAAFMLSSRTQDLNLGNPAGNPAVFSGQETAGYPFSPRRGNSSFGLPSDEFQLVTGPAPIAGNRFQLDRRGDGTQLAEFGVPARGSEPSPRPPFELVAHPDQLWLQPIPRGQTPANRP